MMEWADESSMGGMGSGLIVHDAIPRRLGARILGSAAARPAVVICSTDHPAACPYGMRSRKMPDLAVADCLFDHTESHLRCPPCPGCKYVWPSARNKPNTTPLWSHTHLLALFEADAEPEAVFAHLQLLTGAALPEHQAEVIEDQDWERSWMDGFQPMRFGQRLWIVPSWHEAPEKDAVNLLLDPGLAFGTGTHPTTALCLEWLDGQSLAGTQVLDFGCGSGILAIAALLLGAREAVGTDIDVQAIEASRDNAQRNGIADEKLALYLPEHMPAMQADVLVANILAGPLVSLAPQLSGLVRPGGLLALSGILAEQGEEVAAAYAADFDLDPIVVRDGWVRISGHRR